MALSLCAAPVSHATRWERLAGTGRLLAGLALCAGRPEPARAADPSSFAAPSRATEVWLRLTMQDCALTLIIEDNGCGFDLVHSALRIPQSALGNGLVNMRERMAQIGGQFHLESQPGHGTRLELRLPL